jgi:carbon storage regulator CsrA
MLVLSRRVADQIVIPSLGITLEVLSIKGNLVKLGIDAPHDVRVLRGELIGKPAHCQSETKTSGIAKIEQEATTSEAVTKPVNEMVIEVESSPLIARSAPLRSYLSNSSKYRNDGKRISNGKPANTANRYAAETSGDSVKEPRAIYDVCV